MSNTPNVNGLNGHDTGASPRASARRAARGVPASPDVQQAAFGQLIQTAVQAAVEASSQKIACSLCTGQRKQTEMAYAVAFANSQQAAEPPPPAPQLPDIQQAVTWQPMTIAPDTPPVVVPVCYPHFQVGTAQRPVGLVDAQGRQIVARG